MPVQNEKLICNFPQPLDDRYFAKNGSPWASVFEVNSTLHPARRFQGLTVNILGVEYWYELGVTDLDLMPKHASGTCEPIQVDGPPFTAGAVGRIIVDYSGYLEAYQDAEIRLVTVDKFDGQRIGSAIVPTGEFDTVLLMSDIAMNYAANNPTSRYTVYAAGTGIVVLQNDPVTDPLMNAYSESLGSVGPEGPKPPKVFEEGVSPQSFESDCLGQQAHEDLGDGTTRIWIYTLNGWMPTDGDGNFVHGGAYVMPAELYLTARDGGELGTGTINDPYNIATVSKFLEVLQRETNLNRPSNWNFSAGEFVMPHACLGYNSPNINTWLFRDKWTWRGAGMGKTILIPDASELQNSAFHFAICTGLNGIDDEFYISQGAIYDLTIDGRIFTEANPWGQRSINISAGRFIVQRVEVCNSGGRYGEFNEEFPILIGSGHADGTVDQNAFLMVDSCHVHDIRTGDMFGSSCAIACGKRAFGHTYTVPSYITNNRVVNAGYIGLASDNRVENNYVDPGLWGDPASKNGRSHCIHADTGIYKDMLLRGNILVNGFSPFSNGVDIRGGSIRLGGSVTMNNVVIEDNFISFLANGGFMAAVFLQGNAKGIIIRNNSVDPCFYPAGEPFNTRLVLEYGTGNSWQAKGNYLSDHSYSPNFDDTPLTQNEENGLRASGVLFEDNGAFRVFFGQYNSHKKLTLSLDAGVPDQQIMAGSWLIEMCAKRQDNQINLDIACILNVAKSYSDGVTHHGWATEMTPLRQGGNMGATVPVFNPTAIVLEIHINAQFIIGGVDIRVTRLASCVGNYAPVSEVWTTADETNVAWTTANTARLSNLSIGEPLTFGIVATGEAPEASPYAGRIVVADKNDNAIKIFNRVTGVWNRVDNLPVAELIDIMQPLLQSHFDTRYSQLP